MIYQYNWPEELLQNLRTSHFPKKLSTDRRTTERSLNSLSRFTIKT